MSVVVLAVLSASSARAASADARTEAAREHSRQADAYYKLEKYPNAIGEYEQAYLSKPDASFLFNIAQCHRLMGHAAEAIKFYRRFLNDAAPGAPSRAVAEKHIRDLEEASKATITEPPAGPPVTPLPPATSPPPTGVGVTTPVGLGATNPTPGPTPAVDQTGTLGGFLGPPATTPLGEAQLRQRQTSSAPPSDEAKPFYYKWWFWTAVGAVVATGIVIGIVASRHDPACPEMATCR
ncbi:MAG TPA: tetratricopeptide repeat protein [Polyangia bacterium]|nr:tetratricopeptide repeat protein [Polyangia bacterium]